jgi:antitoxin (DNA-binding transcriptional repressor) of toxin-antitoxin stability system
MGEQTVTIRELRTDFRSVKRKIEQHGGVVVTDRGEPAYLLQPLPRKARAPGPMPDYLARMRLRQPRPLTAEQTRRLWEDERGDR